ncbi:sterol desaturase family protein [Williamwhitmania taraxaci]|nr:beta-carotene hydroxylase [Williamwhitmania taraxaci]
MEFVAWSNHKYVMHGFLWNWHIDHHRKDNLQGLPLNTEDKLLEKNDLFFLVYAIPAIILMIVGFSIQSMPMVFVSVGITLYGFTYFAIHDIIIHNRIKISFLQGKHNFFIEAVIKAHTAHHKPKNKQDFNNYGLLVFPLKFLKS